MSIAGGTGSRDLRWKCIVTAELFPPERVSATSDIGAPELHCECHDLSMVLVRAPWLGFPAWVGDIVTFLVVYGSIVLILWALQRPPS